MSKPSTVRANIAAGLFALGAGLAIAWMDTRPSWDDSGLTAGALALASGIAAFAGLRWWLVPILVAGPLFVAEFRGLGWGALLICAIALAGAGVGLAVRRPWR